MIKIYNYTDFKSAMRRCGFSMGGSNSDGIFSLIGWGWKETAPYDTPICWHTGDPETDPWEWRIRVLNEQSDIAYAKLFFKKSGYITKEWYPYFLAARRGNTDLHEDYADGNISSYAKQIYDLLSEKGALPTHAIKKLLDVPKADNSKYERAIVELQMKMYITMCGAAQKRNRYGEEYGWSSGMFCRVEDYWGQEVFDKAREISTGKAIEKITQQIYKLNPDADQKNIIKFICKV